MDKDNNLMLMDNDKDKSFKIHDPAIIIIILTAASYGIAYTYQISYMKFYHLPSIFVELNITNMVRPLLLIFCMLSIFYYVIYIITRSKEIKINVYIVPAILLGSLISGILFGGFKASTEKQYLVIQQENRFFVAITSYKDSIIIAPLDLEKESITPTFKAIEMKELKDAETVRFENGLKVEDVRKNKDLNEQIFFGSH